MLFKNIYYRNTKLKKKIAKIKIIMFHLGIKRIEKLEDQFFFFF